MRRIKKYMGVFAVTFALTLVACSSADVASSDEEADTETAETGEEGTSYTGTVSAVSTTSITISTEDGEELEFTFTDDTVFSRGGMSGDMDDMGGEMPSEGGGEQPDGEMPSGDGEEPADGEMPSGDAGEQPDGEVPSGDAEEPADGEAPSGDAGEQPDGEAPSGDAEESADGEAPSGDGEEPADGEMPSGDVEEPADGEAPSGDGGGQPDGDGAGGGMPEGGQGGDMSGGSFDEELTYSDISVGDEVTVTADDDGNALTVVISAGGMGGGGDMGGDVGGGDSSGVDSYDAVNEYTEDVEVSDTTLESTGTDENAVLVATSGITVTLDDVEIIRDSEDSTGGDNSSFYGVGAAALVTDGTLVISDSTVDSDADGGAGVFAYGNGTAYVSDTVITTQQDTSGGVHVAGGGTLYAWDLTVETNGESSAAIRSDRGSGTMVVDGGTYITNWTGSPAVYSTADITVNGATLTANSSEAVCIEGLNTVRLYDCDLTGSMQDLETNDCTWTVILYQSMSGDSEVGNSTFEMAGGSLTSTNGGIFYTTNTESTFVISDVDITCPDDSEFLLKVTGNSNSRGWGTSGSNGADCSFTAIEQELEGAVIWDSISTLEMYLSDGSILTGYFEDDETNAGDGGDGYANLYIDADSTWVVTADSVLSSLQCEGTVIDGSGDTVTIVGSDGTTYVSGTGSYTVTVDTYSATADMSGASEAGSFEDYEVEEL